MNGYTIIILSLSLVSLSCADEAPIVKTTYGQIKGKYTRSRNGRVFAAFLGIPYAAPPVGELRFHPPTSPQKWEGVRDSTKEGNILCSQGKYGGQEDCLYVNVFTHRNETLLPVMFYIHGGSFYMGSPSITITGPDYFMDKDVVLVTVRYRLGPFGFLSTEDAVIPGNMGMKDQVKALHWVQENIKSFGGDPEKVTLFGCSAGGSSVHLHMQSLASQSLFVRGISQSGTGLSAFTLMGKGTARKATLQLSKHLNCSSENSTEILQCLQKKGAADIEQAHQNLQTIRHAITKSIFRPVVEEINDHIFLTSSPLLAKTHKPWLTGITANEGVLNIRMKYLNYTLDKIKSEFNTYGPTALLFDDVCSRPNEIADIIYHFYFKNNSSTQDMMKSLERIYTDWWYLWPLQQAIQQHEGILYLYLFDHRGEHSYTEVYDSPNDLGVSHLDDLLSLFRHVQYFPTLNEQDTHMSKLMVDLWVNFATFENPTPLMISKNPQTSNIANFKWTVSNNTNPLHLHIQTHQLSMQHEIYTKRLEFWRNLRVIDKLP